MCAWGQTGHLWARLDPLCPLTTGSPRQVVRVVAAWAEAARQWEAAGRPPLEEANDREVEGAVGELVS